MSPHWRRLLTVIAGLAWVAAVMVSYYSHNAAYYREKVSVFSRFLLPS